MKVAVTGGTGCLGQPLIKKLIENDCSIKLLALPNDTALSSFNKRVQVITGTINSKEALLLLTQNCDVVFHLASKVHFIPKNKSEEEIFYKINVIGTKSLLEAARYNKVRRFILYSSVSVYGREFNFHGNEFSYCQPVTAYARSKYLAEKYLFEEVQKGEMEGVVLRFPVAYGPFDRGNIAHLIKAIYCGYFFYCGPGNNLRSMISSKNSAEAAFSAAFESMSASQVFCITDGNDYKLKELVETICKAIDKRRYPFHMPSPLVELVGKVGSLLEKLTHKNVLLTSHNLKRLNGALTFSCEKAKKILKYKPVETLSEGISKEINWLRKVFDWN